ncbi:hypothetical protein Rhal01_01176 [Rubritalea halochordaticola]|uniref:DUF5076 domain-containing protein n=1 Tax=Rubritalea halochordaticola TaxID=714537 RepID=A0ABP9V2Z9_9BACT
MRELTKPTGVDADPRATEMIRFWLANNEPNISLLLGMWEDADDSDVDELWAWGNVLADIAQHIANGLEQSHGWDYSSSMETLRQAFIQASRERDLGLEGGYVE